MLLLLLGAVALNLLLLLVAHVPEGKRLIGDERYYFALASARARGEAPQPVPFWPPLYPAVLTAVFRLLGPGVLPVQLIQIALWLLVCLLWYRLTAALLPGRRGLATTLVLVLLAADLGPFAHYLWPEVLHLALASAALALLAFHGRQLGGVFLAGLALGLALLSKLMLGPLVPVLAGVAAAAAGGSRRRRAVAAAVLVLGVAIPTVPIALGNARAGRPVTTSSATFNLWVGLNDPPLAEDARDIAGPEARRYRESATTVAGRNAVYRAKIRAKVAADGLPLLAWRQLGKQYFRLFDRQTFFVEQLPGGKRPAYGFDVPWLATLLRWYADLTHAALLAMAAFGLAFLGRRRPGWPHLFAGFLLYNLALFVAFHTTTRFVVQMVPFLAFFAGFGVSAVTREAPDADGMAAATPARIAVGAALAALVLYLAFRSLLRAAGG